LVKLANSGPRFLHSTETDKTDGALLADDSYEKVADDFTAYCG
jgi:hypothetical protein